MATILTLAQILHLLLIPLQQSTPAKPDFSGHWIEDSRPVPPDGQLGFCPKDCTITQTVQTLTIKSSLGTRTVDLAKPTITTDTSSRVAVETTVTAVWQGATLVITSQYKENTPTASTLTSDVQLTLRDGLLAISGTSLRPGAGSVKFEVLYRKALATRTPETADERQELSWPQLSLAGVRDLDVLTSVALITATVIVVRARLKSDGHDPVSPSIIPVPAEPIPIAASPTAGTLDARFALIEFADFECPFCGRFARETLPALRERFVSTGKLLLVFKHLPLPIHKDAERVARVAECARQQGRFWPIYDYLFTDSRVADPAAVSGAIDAIGLNRDSFNSCISRPSDVISADAALASKLGVTGTPAFFFGSKSGNSEVKVLSTLSGAQNLEQFIDLLQPVNRR